MEDDMYGDAERNELVSRLDKLLTVANDTNGWLKTNVYSAAANSGKVLTYRNPKGSVVAIDVEAGYWHGFASGDELASAQRLGIVTSAGPIDVTDAEMSDLLSKAQARNQSLTSK